LCALAVVAGCASDVARMPVEISTTQEQKRYIASAPAEIHLDSGYQRTISQGTEFVEVGVIRQGRILKPTVTTFTIEGAHVHEAYPVVQNQRLVGFYLPVERAFSPLSHPTNLMLEERKP
jgi:hypothetical protein